MSHKLLDGHDERVLEQVAEHSAVEDVHGAIVARRSKQRVAAVVGHRTQRLVVVSGGVWRVIVRMIGLLFGLVWQECPSSWVKGSRV